MNHSQTPQHGSTKTQTVPATEITQTDREYVNKYLPEMWTALKRANADDVHLLRMKKLEAPAKSLYEAVKSCIVNYLEAIKPVALVKLNAESSNSCSIRVVKEHVDVLRIASTQAFRCLKLYKIGISNVYADAPQVPNAKLPNDNRFRAVFVKNCFVCIFSFRQTISSQLIRRTPTVSLN